MSQVEPFLSRVAGPRCKSSFEREEQFAVFPESNHASSLTILSVSALHVKLVLDSCGVLFYKGDVLCRPAALWETDIRFAGVPF